MEMNSLQDLFIHDLKDLYNAEIQLVKALPKMAKAASSDKLRAAFEKHHGETEGQIERLEQIFESLEVPARGKTCDASAWSRFSRSWMKVPRARSAKPWKG